MIDKYTGLEIISPADKLNDEETLAIRNNTADFLAGVIVIKRCATAEQWANFLAGLDDEARNIARRFFCEQEEFPLRNYSSRQSNGTPGGQGTDNRSDGRSESHDPESGIATLPQGGKNSFLDDSIVKPRGPGSGVERGTKFFCKVVKWLTLQKDGLHGLFS